MPSDKVLTESLRETKTSSACFRLSAHMLLNMHSLRFSKVLLVSFNRLYATSRKTIPKVKYEDYQKKANQVKSNSDHALKNLFPWKTKQEFVEHLAANVIYNKDGLIAINKPYGVPLQKQGLTIGTNDCPFSLEEALIPLALLLQVEKLWPVKMAEKFSSGVSLFTCKEKMVEKIRHSYVLNKAQNISTFKYLAVTVGEPKPSTGKETIGMGSFEHKDHVGKLPVIVTDYSNKKVAAGLIQEYRIRYRTLSRQNGLCSLVELDVSSVKNHFLRVYLAHLFSPILGDHLFGNRVQDILGKRLAISPLQADGLAKFQKVPANILTGLNLSESALVPTCLHLSQVTLAQFSNKDSSNLVLSADPSPCFQYVCQALDLNPFIISSD